MITIQSGKLIIPEEDRFVGFAGDNLGNSKSFILPGHGADSNSYTLCLRFDDDSVRVIPLTKSLSGADTVLTWNVRASHLLKSGIVMAQVKSVDSDDVILHSSCDYFIIADSAEVIEDDPDYVARDEFEERMTAILTQIRDSAPYIGEDGYWYVYDIETAAYERSVSVTAHITIDDTLTAGGANPVEGGAIKAYVDTALDAKVNKTTTIAALPLSGNIRASDLAANMSAYINPSTVQPDITSGYIGQFGRTFDGKPAMCTGSTAWAPLAKAADVYTKTEINTMIGDLETALGGV